MPMQIRRLPGSAMNVAAMKALRHEGKIESRLALADPLLGRLIAAVIDRIGSQRIARSRTTPFEALVRAVVFQSISGKAATSIFARLKDKIEKPITPSTICALRPQFLTKAGLSGAKARTILNIATWFMSNRKLAQALPKLADDEIVEALTAIPGVGEWTVDVLLIFNLGRLDVVPAADHSIRRGVTLAYGLRTVASSKEVLERSRAWRPYRSVASLYLRQAVKLKLLPDDLKKVKNR